MLYQEQVYQDWPGLAVETRNICEILGMTDVNQNALKKTDIAKAIKTHDGKEIVEKMMKYEKVDKIKDDDPTMPKEYLETRSIADCRMLFRLRTEMVDLKDNMRGRYKGYNTNCEACQENVPESQTHVMICSAYRDIRLGKDLNDNRNLVKYYREVLLRREKKRKND